MSQRVVPAQRDGQRLLWADAAKGLSIMLVVLHHLTSKHYGIVVPEAVGFLEGAWLSLSAALKPLRMPLFFILSGLFASSALRRPWRHVVEARIINPYYLYVVWLCILAVVFALEQTLATNRTGNAKELLADLVYASTGLWYLYAFALYFLLAWVLRAADPRLVVACATVVAATAWMLPIDEVNRVSVLQNFVYFAVGAYFPGAVRRTADLRHRHTIAAMGVTYVALGGFLLWIGAAPGPNHPRAEPSRDPAGDQGCHRSI